MKKTIPEGFRKNVSTEAGHDLGAEMARLCDSAEPNARLRCPALPPRCSSCAFREGKHLANGSESTLMNALKCVVEGEEFYCHDTHRKGELCAGWCMFMLAEDAPQFKDAPWEFVEGRDAP